MLKKNSLAKLTDRNSLFYFLLCFNLLLVFVVKFYSSLDGPAHLYNSGVLLNLLKGNSFLSDYYTINPLPVPNWTSHFILSFLLVFLPSWLAEKFLVMIYISGMAFSFRFLVKQLNPQNTGASVLIFPFIFSFLFHLGFYNFSLSSILLFLSIGFWIKTYHRHYWADYLFLFLLITTAFFTNVLILGFIGLTLGFYTLYHTFKKSSDQPFGFKAACSHGLKKLVFLLFISIPGLLLSFSFYQNFKLANSVEGYKLSTLLGWILSLRPLISYNYEQDRFFTILFFLVLMLLFVLGFVKKISGNAVSKSNLVIFLIPTFIVLLLLLITPDSSGAGMMSFRYCHLFFIFLLIVIVSQFKFNHFSRLLLLIFLFLHVGLQLKNFNGAIKPLNRKAKMIENVDSYIADNSVVLPIEMSSKWLEHHFSNYLGVNKPMVILENYEATVGWFPVMWNKEKLPNILLGNKSSISGVVWPTNENATQVKQIDYIFIYGDLNELNDPKWADLKNTLSTSFNLVHESKNNYATLYSKK